MRLSLYRMQLITDHLQGLGYVFRPTGISLLEQSALTYSAHHCTSLASRAGIRLVSTAGVAALTADRTLNGELDSGGALCLLVDGGAYLIADGKPAHE